MSTSTSYAAVLRVKPITRGSLKHVHGHNSRTPQYTKSASHIDHERSAYNHTFVGDDIQSDVLKRIDGISMSRRGKTEKDEQIAAELILTAADDFFQSIDDDAYIRWQDKSVDWLKEKYGDRLVSAVLHYDEKAPHIHAIVVPVLEKSRTHPVTKEKMPAKTCICYSDLFGDSKTTLGKARAEGRSHLDTKLGRLQTEYATQMQDLGLVRGQESRRTLEPDLKHVAPHLYRRVKEQYEALQENEKKTLFAIKNEVENNKKTSIAISNDIKNDKKLLKTIKSDIENDKKTRASLELERNGLIAAIAGKVAEKERLEKAISGMPTRAHLEEVLARDKAALKAKYDQDVAALRATFATERAKEQATLDRVISERQGEKKMLEAERSLTAQARAETVQAEAEALEVKRDIKSLQDTREGLLADVKDVRQHIAYLHQKEPVTAWQTACQVYGRQAKREGVGFTLSWVIARIASDFDTKEKAEALLLSVPLEKTGERKAMEDLVDKLDQAEKQKLEQEKKAQRRSQSQGMSM